MMLISSTDSQSVHPVVLLALLQRLIESVTEGQIRLGLCALDEALDLPSTSPSLILLLPILRLLLLLLLRWLLLVLLLCWLGTATTSHHSSDSTASHMANSATNSDTTSG